MTLDFAWKTASLAEMLLALLWLFQRVHGTCDLFTIECHDTGAQFTLDTACYNSTSDVSFSSDLSGVYLTRSYNESTISGDCIVAGSHLAEYYKCFTANEDASGKIDTNYTAEIVHSMTIDGTNLTIARYGDVFCEPRISIDDSKKAMLISEKKIVGSQPQQNAPVIQIEVNGGDTLGSYVNVSVKSVTDDELYSQELVDCNVTSEGHLFQILENGAITDTGVKLHGALLSASELQFKRFSLRFNVATAFDVSCSVILKSANSNSAVITTTTSTSTTTTTTTTTTTSSTTTPSASGYFTVLAEYTDDNNDYAKARDLTFVISEDGTFQADRSYSYNFQDLQECAHTLFQGSTYMFCGTSISKIESCGVVSLALSLEKTADESTAIANIDDNAVYLCFNFSPYKTCQMFDGSSVSMITSDASYDHDGACLANYKGYPLAVGTYSGVQVAYYSATTGWNYLADHPGENSKNGGCVNVDTKVVKIGGDDNPNQVYFFETLTDVWTDAGTLQASHQYNSILAFGNIIFSTSLYNGAILGIERIDISTSTITSSLIYTLPSQNYMQSYRYKRPVLLTTGQYDCL